MINKKIQGKKNRQSGRNFELKVRKDLESKGWICSKWMNQIIFDDIVRIDADKDTSFEAFDKKRFETGKLIPAKHKFRGKGIPMAIGTGFPDFICFKSQYKVWHISKGELQLHTFICERCREKIFAYWGIEDGKPDCHLCGGNLIRIGPTKDGEKIREGYEIIGVEVKSNGYLDKEEKEKCRWLLENNVFSKILIASKGNKRGEIIYKEFENE